jgi:hypothetical protein
VELRSCELLQGAGGGLQARDADTLVQVFAGGISRNPRWVRLGNRTGYLC